MRYRSEVKCDCCGTWVPESTATQTRRQYPVMSVTTTLCAACQRDADERSGNDTLAEAMREIQRRTRKAAT